MSSRAERLERRLEAVRAERDAVEQLAHVRQAEQLDRIRELERRVVTLSATLRAIRDDVERANSSRAWRYGHGVARVARRIAMRTDKTEGALVAALDRIEQVQYAMGTLPAGPSTAAAAGAAPPRRAPAAAIEEPTRHAEPAPAQTVAQVAAQRRLVAAEIRDRLGEPPELDSWPAMSLVLLGGGGVDQLQRVAHGLLEHTDYPSVELVVVDAGQSDESRALLAESDTGMPVRVVAGPGVASFAEGCSQGAAVAAHDLLLFLGDAVEPFERGWLRELVAAHVTGARAATGATLLHAEDSSRRAAGGRLVQHRALRLRAAADGSQPYDDGDGEDLFDAGFGLERAVPAIAAACMLVERSTFERCGGFATGFGDGHEDVDLGLRLTQAGLAMATTGRAIVYHRAPSSLRAAGRDSAQANRRAFLARWGAPARRAYRLGRLRCDPFWTDGGGPRVAIAVTSLDAAAGWDEWRTAHELGDALEQLGWRVGYIAAQDDGLWRLPAGLDYVITLIDGFNASAVPADVVVGAWITNDTERWIERPWFASLDFVLASSVTSADIVEQRAGRRPVVFPLATNPARFPIKENGSAELVVDDTQESRRRDGFVGARVFDGLAAGSVVLSNSVQGVRELFGDELPTWSTPDELARLRDRLLADDDRRREIARRLRATVLARHTYAHRAHRLVELLGELESRPSFCIRGDLRHARALERALRRRGHRCLIEEGGGRERIDGLSYDIVVHVGGMSLPVPNPGQHNVLWCVSDPGELTCEECDVYDLVCVASQSLADELREQTGTPVIVIEHATDPAVFFPDPEPDPTAHREVVHITESSEHLPDSEQRVVYSSASIVVIDHREDLREHGFVSHRIFDALACGACVVSDDVRGIAGRFGGAVSVYRSPEELHTLVRRLIADPADRIVRGAAGREVVLAGDTLAHRVNALMASIDTAALPSLVRA